MRRERYTTSSALDEYRKQLTDANHYSVEGDDLVSDVYDEYDEYTELNTQATDFTTRHTDADGIWTENSATIAS